MIAWKLFHLLLCVFTSAANEYLDSPANGTSLRNICFMSVKKCSRFPHLIGSHDDSEDAYQQLNVGRSEPACLSRAVHVWEMCGNSAVDPAVATFLPTGNSDIYPPSHEVIEATDRLEQLFTAYNKAYKPHPITVQQSAGITPNTRRFIAPAGMSWPEARELLPAHRGLCRVDILTCHLVPWLSGRGDDLDDAYASLRVGESEAACLARARFFWQLCGADPFQQANATFEPSGARAAFPDDAHVRRSLARRAPGLVLATDAAEGPAPAGRPRGGGWRAVHVYVGPSAHATWAGPRGWMAECLQDLHVMQILGFRRGGFFVDLAAHDAALCGGTHSARTRTRTRPRAARGPHTPTTSPTHKYTHPRTLPSPSLPPPLPPSLPLSHKHECARAHTPTQTQARARACAHAALSEVSQSVSDSEREMGKQDCALSLSLSPSPSPSLPPSLSPSLSLSLSL